MADLAFTDRFAAGVLDGSKPFTLRRAWRNGKTPDLGHKVRLITGARTKSRRVFATGVIGFRATVLIAPNRLVSLDDHRQLATWSAQARLVFTTARAAFEPEWAFQFAHLDGFDTWLAFWEFHAGHRAPGSPDLAARELIGLCGVSEAFADA